MVLEEGEIVLCTVDRIIGTVVFVKIDREKREGSIVLSEIAPGRIRNLRDYVVPKKRIVCKVLRISENRIDISLRRVTPKERKEVIEHYNQNKSYQSILKTILKDKAEEKIEEIEQEKDISEFFEDAKKDSKKLEKLLGKENSEKILEIIKKQKEKKIILKREIFLYTPKEDGLELIKKILMEIKNAKIKYISAGRYSIETESNDIKKADGNLKEIFQNLENKSKKEGLEFSVKEK